MSVLEGLEPKPRRYECKVGTTLKSLEQVDREILEEALADWQKWSSYSLSQALAKRGVNIYDKAIRKHREGICSCSKT